MDTGTQQMCASRKVTGIDAGAHAARHHRLIDINKYITSVALAQLPLLAVHCHLLLVAAAQFACMAGFGQKCPALGSIVRVVVTICLPPTSSRKNFAQGRLLVLIADVLARVARHPAICCLHVVITLHLYLRCHATILSPSTTPTSFVSVRHRWLLLFIINLHHLHVIILVLGHAVFSRAPSGASTLGVPLDKV
jgi:hypothetical protein